MPVTGIASWSNVLVVVLSLSKNALAAIKNVGYKAAEHIVEHRKEKGNYKNIFELSTSGKHAINKKVIESLILVGACNSLQNHRAELFSSLERIQPWPYTLFGGGKSAANKKAGQ